MKKKYAITLSALVLLSAGITLFGIKSKNKKETEKIEKDLKEVLIPNAESRLDSLQKEYEVTIALYEEQLKQMGGLEQTRDSLERVVMLGEQIKQVDSLFNQLADRWYSKTNRLAQELGAEAYGEDGVLSGYMKADGSEWDGTVPASKSKQAKELYYLTGNECRKLPYVPEGGKTLLTDSLYIPSMNCETYYDGTSSNPYTGIERYSYWGDEESRKGRYTNDLDDFFWVMRHYAMPVVTDTIQPDYVADGQVRFLKDDSLEYVLSVLATLQRFVDSIDNSGNAFDSKTLSDLKKTVKALKAGLENQIAVTRKMALTQQKVSNYRAAGNKLQRQIQKQNDELRKYKSPGIVKQMQYAKRKGSK